MTNEHLPEEWEDCAQCTVCGARLHWAGTDICEHCADQQRQNQDRAQKEPS